MRSIERRDTGESHEAFIRRLAEASGVETPTRAELARFDRSRKNKKTSNKEWKSPQDPDAKIAKMKDGRTHLAHKAEHGVDMDTGAIVAVTVQDASDGDTATLPETLIMAAEQVEAVQPNGVGVEEVVADKGYHSDATLVALDTIGVRSHVSEPERGRRCWQDKKTGEKPPEKAAAQKALYGNRRRVRGRPGRRLQRCRGEVVERTFAHLYETGGMRRVWVRGHENVRKRVLIQAAACNIGLWGAPSVLGHGLKENPMSPGGGGMVRSRGVKGARRATGVGADAAAMGSGALAPGQRWSASRKRDVVLRLLRGEPLDPVSREVGVEVYRLERWKTRALAGLELGLKEQAGEPLAAELDAAKRHIGELSMENELLRSRARAAERRLPLATRRSRR